MEAFCMAHIMEDHAWNICGEHTRRGYLELFLLGPRDQRVKGKGPRKGYRAGFENGPRLRRLPWLLFGCALRGAPLPIGFLPVVRGRSLSVPRAGCHLCIKVTNGVPCNVRKYLCVMLCPTERHHEGLHTRSLAPNWRGRRRRGTVS